MSAEKKYSLHEVKTSADVAEFHALVHFIYAKDNAWVCPLEEEVEGVFTPSKNELFKDGEAIRWILKNESGKTIGRVAAFYNRKKIETQKVKSGGMGFFECINDGKAATLLFDTAKTWLQSKGLEAMDGPINFGENDTFWGLLTHGFTHPSFGMNYNPSYYQGFFEHYGFRLYYEQISKHLDISAPMPERFTKIAEWVSKKPGVRMDYARKSNLKKYGNDFIEVYNDAWKTHNGFTPLKEHHVEKLVSRMIHVIIEKFMIFAYVHDEPAGFLFCLPDLNQVFKPLKGKFSLWQKILFKLRSRNSFAWYRSRGILNRGRVIIIGVKPKFQKMGIESALTMFSIKDAAAMNFKEIELSWVGEFNPMSRSLQDATGAKLGKKHFTYRFMFDPNQEWVPYETLAVDMRKVEE